MKQKLLILILEQLFNSMKFIKKIFLFLFIFSSSGSYLQADLPYFIDFKYILNNSDAGKKAQDQLKKRLENGIKSINSKQRKLQEEEKKVIQQKKIISAEDYKKKVSGLRIKVSDLAKERDTLLESVASQRSKARKELLKNLNPIIADYMKEKNIRMIVDKKSILLADDKLDATKEIIKKLNSKLKSINLN